MSRHLKSASISVFLMLLLTGCWDIKHIQDVNYLTSLGFDYVDDRYVIYVQMLDFTSVAKSESGKPTQPVPVWVGKGEGATPIDAFNDLYGSSQLRIFYGQVNSIVFSERMLKKGLDLIINFQRRYYELRYTPWLFGTREPIDKLFAITPFFNLSPLMSLLHQPQESFKQKSIITPMTIREFISSWNEPGRATLLPSLSYTDKAWKSDKKPKEVLEMDGVFLFQEKSYRGWLQEADIPGLRWSTHRTNRSPLLLQNDGNDRVTLSLERPEVRIVPEQTGDRIAYKMQVKLNGYISESRMPLPESELEQLAAERVRTEIVDTYNKGLSLGTDLLQLEHTLYRKNVRTWKKLKELGRSKPDANSLKDVQVKVEVTHSGKIKYDSGTGT